MKAVVDKRKICPFPQFIEEELNDAIHLEVHMRTDFWR